jgi:hypothetical protein
MAPELPRRARRARALTAVSEPAWRDGLGLVVPRRGAEPVPDGPATVPTDDDWCHLAVDWSTTRRPVLFDVEADDDPPAPSVWHR